MGKNRWLKCKIKDYFYDSKEDKLNPNILPKEYDVPFYVSTEPIHEQLLILASSYSTEHYGECYTKINFPWCPGPSPSCLGDVSLWESIFQLIVFS